MSLPPSSLFFFCILAFPSGQLERPRGKTRPFLDLGRGLYFTLNAPIRSGRGARRNLTCNSKDVYDG